MRLIKKADGWYNLYDGEIGIGSTHEDLQGHKLSKQNCDEIFGVVDVEKLADEYCTHEPKNAKELRDVNLIKLGFRSGFNKAMELYQPTEIEVEIEMECETGCNNFIFNGNKSICCGNKIPKLDENNNLILRKWS